MRLYTNMKNGYKKNGATNITKIYHKILGFKLQIYLCDTHKIM